MLYLLYSFFGLYFLVFCPFLLLPKSLTFLWNFGSCLGVVLSVQFFSGLFLTFHMGQHPFGFSSNSLFHSFLGNFHVLIDYMRITCVGFQFRFTHANGASFFLFFMFVHLFRGMYFLGANKINLWLSGCLILLLSMGASFLSYVLPFGQMSFWGATVIVNLLSVIPIIGGSICILAWGGFCVSYFTVKRFFTFHFLLPFVVLVLVLVHLILLHFYGSNSTNMSLHRISFFKVFFVKDFLSWVLFFGFFSFLYSIEMNMLGDVENYLISNPMQTPLHIKPEWYFLFAYSILRCIPSKSGSVIALAFSVMIPSILSVGSFKGLNLFCFRLLFFFVLLTVTGSMPVEEPYILFSQFVSMGYFLVYFFGF